MNKWLELAAKCEAATGPDREIDWDIGLATGWRRDIYDGHNMLVDWDCNMFPEHPGAIWPSVTESLDVVAALIERELQGWSVGSHSHLRYKDAMIDYWEAGLSRAHISTRLPTLFVGKAKTEALARCAAFCRAMAAKSPEEIPETVSADCK